MDIFIHVVDDVLSGLIFAIGIAAVVLLIPICIVSYHSILYGGFFKPPRPPPPPSCPPKSILKTTE